MVLPLLAVGQTFSRYVIEAAIGQGGMGEVYRAYDEKLRRKVALKVLHPDLDVPDAAARLVREARAAAALAHPNTIAIHDLGEIEGTVFLVMELVSGVPLRAYVGDDAIPIATKLRWLVDIARGLGAAHKAGLVHRDVKPTNVMISDEGVVKVLDFGLAKPVEAASFRTDVGLVVGTPRYMAPELFTGMAADARSDQYAFGVTAYELLSGVHPGSPVSAVPAALDELVPEAGPAVARVIARTLARTPADRFASMSEIASALEEALATSRVSRVSEARDVTPPTRREGAAKAEPAPLAFAATELVASRPKHVPLATELNQRRSRGPSTLAVATIFGVLAAGGAYGAARWVGGDLVSGGDAAAPSDLASSIDDGGDAEALAFVDPPGDAGLPEASEAGAIDAAPDADDDGSAADAASERPTHPVHLEDFQDPWAKPAPR